jgi:hypothetical protein
MVKVKMLKKSKLFLSITCGITLCLSVATIAIVHNSSTNTSLNSGDNASLVKNSDNVDAPTAASKVITYLANHSQRTLIHAIVDHAMGSTTSIPDSSPTVPCFAETDEEPPIAVTTSSFTITSSDASSHGLSFNTTTGVISGTPTSTFEGTFLIKAVTTDPT